MFKKKKKSLLTGHLKLADTDFFHLDTYLVNADALVNGSPLRPLEKKQLMSMNFCTFGIYMLKSLLELSC